MKDKSKCSFPYRGTVSGGNTRISVLLNSVYYFLQYAFIITAKGDSRLVVIHNNRVLLDHHYKTLRGARIAFQKKYKTKAWKNDIKANWSDKREDFVR